MEETRPVLSSLNKAILKDVLSSLPESRRKPGRTSSAWWWSGRHRSAASSRWTEPWRSGWADSRPAWANYELWTAESPITPRRCTLPTVLCSSAARCPLLTTSPASATGPSRQWTRYRGRKRRRIAPRRFLWKRTWEKQKEILLFRLIKDTHVFTRSLSYTRKNRYRLQAPFCLKARLHLGQSLWSLERINNSEVWCFAAESRSYLL